ncbi:FHF complex subunit HOOK interacting protein 2A-like [Phlebotomus argentipes]|uniref:FHF complex subunit HOOK interacting protein 2A-like n=1 Tax=Phlebotomus argentipes TaxID=94469 RepID=UPI002893817A|nr:FHF complex subunit HOOK interacting protein 2A-like [Phlebotomus argentipes]
MLGCRRLRVLDKMFGRLSDALHTAADVLAPPPTPLQDFEYHWRIVKTFYSVSQDLPKVHISNTNVPVHLEEMLQILVREQSAEAAGLMAGPRECMDHLLTTNPLEFLVEKSVSDTPPGIRMHTISWLRRFLSCLENPPISHGSIFQPVQKLLSLCQGNGSPYEKEEILFLTTVAAVVRRNPWHVNLFLPSHQHLLPLTSTLSGMAPAKPPTGNPLFDCSKEKAKRISFVPDINAPSSSDDQASQQDPTICDINCSQRDSVSSGKIAFGCDCDEKEDRFTLLDSIVLYLDSPDHTIVVRAGEAALILTSLPTIDLSCGAMKSSLDTFGDFLMERVWHFCRRIPEDMNPEDIEDVNVSWGLTLRDSDVPEFIGRPQLVEFLAWLDYADCVAKECENLHPNMSEKFRSLILENAIEPYLLDANAAFTLLLTAKIVRQIHSAAFMNEIATWLVAEENISAIVGGDCLLTILIENCQYNTPLVFHTLLFVEALLENPNERILHGLLFCYLNRRGYCDPSAQVTQTWSDEEDERHRRRGSATIAVKSRTLAPSNIMKIINNFLLLLPKQMLNESVGTCYEEYMKDANQHYRTWIKKTEHFNWPVEAVFPEKDDLTPECVSPISGAIVPSRGPKRESQCNDSGISEEIFSEGPLLKLLFRHIRNMANQPYEFNLGVIAVMSKLALLPHPYLHEILLNPEIAVTPGASTLWTVLQDVAKQLLMEIPRIEGFQQKIAETEERLLTNPPLISEPSDKNETLFEAIVVLKEFCKELAAIAFVKYNRSTE